MMFYGEKRYSGEHWQHEEEEMAASEGEKRQILYSVDGSAFLTPLNDLDKAYH